MATKNTKEHKKSRRRQMLKTGCLSVVVLFLVFVLAATAWVFYMTSGEPEVVHDEDLIYNPQTVPVEENAYFVLQPVIQNIESNDIDLSVFSTDGVETVPEFLEKHPEILDTFYSMARYDHYQVPFEGKLFGIDYVTELTPPFELLSIGSYSFRYIEWLIQNGRCEEALLRLRDHIRVGQLLQNDAHSLVAGMLANSQVRGSSDLLIRYLSDGTFQQESFSDLQDVLTDFHANNGWWLQMLRAEYSYNKANVLEMGMVMETNMPSLIPSRLSKYNFNESKTLKSYEQYYHCLIGSCSNSYADWSSPEFSIPSFWGMLFSGNVMGQLLNAIGMPSVTGFMEAMVFDQKTKVGLIGLYLAMWDYYEEEGELPNKLEQLVPDYIPELPVDPFGEGAGFLYDPEKKEIYSAGIKRSEKHDDLRISLGFAEKGTCIDI